MIEYVLILLLFAVVVCNWLFEGDECARDAYH